MPDRLAELREKAAILGIDISDIMDDPEAIQQRIASYRTASISKVAHRRGFFKTGDSITSPQVVEIVSDPPDVA